MRTEVSKSFTWGFVLSEQELRRVFQTCKEHGEKLGPNGSRCRTSAKLKDGSLVESSELDDILCLENSGSKAIQRIGIEFEEPIAEPRWSISVGFQDGSANPESWTSVDFEVAGDSRDQVFLAASDLEERVKKTRILSWPYLTSKRWFLSVAPMLVAMFLLVITMTFIFAPAKQAVEDLERQYSEGKVDDAIQALIFLEKARHSDRFVIILVPLVAPFALFGFIALLLPKVFLAYNFYWGDYIGVFDKRRAFLKVVWIVLVLGVVASVIGGLVLRLVTK